MRVGRPYSPISGKEIKKLSNQEISEFVKNKIRSLKHSPNKKAVMGVEYTEDSVHIFSPVVRGRKGEYYQMLYDLVKDIRRFVLMV